MGLQGRLVVLFGASGGLGAPLAQAFLDAGATVVGADLAVPGPERAVPGVDHRAVDVLSEESVAGLFASLDGAPWAVVNTIGGFAPASAMTDVDLDGLAVQLDLNLRSAATITKHALRAMGEAAEGRIVHTSSRAALVTAGSGLAYSVSKLGVIRLVEMAAAEVRTSGITVNCVLPSIIDTPANRASMPGANFDRWPKPAELAQVYLFLASPESALVSGAAIPAYGRA